MGHIDKKDVSLLSIENCVLEGAQRYTQLYTQFIFLPTLQLSLNDLLPELEKFTAFVHKENLCDYDPSCDSGSCCSPCQQRINHI